MIVNRQMGKHMAGDWKHIVVRHIISITAHSFCVETGRGDVKYIPIKDINNPDQYRAGQTNKPMLITAHVAKQEGISQ